MLERDLKNPKKYWRELLSALRFMGNVGYPRLKDGKDWGDWTLDGLLQKFGEVVDVLRNECYFELRPKDDNSSFWECYKSAKQKGYIKTEPPSGDEIAEWKEKRRKIIGMGLPNGAVNIKEAKDIYEGKINKVTVNKDFFSLLETRYLVDSDKCYGLISFKNSDNGHDFEVDRFYRYDEPKDVKIPKDSCLFVRINNVQESVRRPFIKFIGTKGETESYSKRHMVSNDFKIVFNSLILTKEKLESLESNFETEEIKCSVSKNDNIIYKVNNLIYAPEITSSIDPSVFDNCDTCIVEGYSFDTMYEQRYPLTEIIQMIPNEIRVIITGFGSSMIKNENHYYLKLVESYPEKDITFAHDGMVIELNRDVLNISKYLPTFTWCPEFVSIGGSLVHARSHEPRDIDVIVKATEINGKWYLPVDTSLLHKLERVIQYATKSALGKMIKPDFPPPALMGANASYIPIYHLKLVPATPQIRDTEEEEYAQKIYDMDFKEGLSVNLRVENKDFEKMAEMSEKEDRIEIGRFFIPMKPVIPKRTQKERQTVKSLLALVKYPCYVSTKKDGMRGVIHKDGDKVIVYSEDGSTITNKVPRIVEAVKKLKVNKLCFDCEIESWHNGKHYPREYIIGQIHSKDCDDSSFIASIFDCLFYEEDIHNKPYNERYEILKSIGSDTSFSSDVLRIVTHELCNNEKELAPEVDKKRKEYGSEGVVVKLKNSIYTLNGRPRDNEWVKLHNNVVTNLIVVDVIETSKKGIYNLVVGCIANENANHDNVIESPKGNILIVGKTFNAPYVEKWTPVEIESEGVNVIYSDKGIDIRYYGPRFLRKTNKIDSMDDVIRKSMKENHVLCIKKITSEGVIYESRELVGIIVKDSKISSFPESKEVWVIDQSGHILRRNLTDFTDLDACREIINMNIRKLYAKSMSEEYTKTFHKNGVEVDTTDKDLYDLINDEVNLTESEDPYQPIREDKEHRFVIQSHYRCALKDILNEIGKSELWNELESNWDKWNEVKEELEKYFDSHPNYKHSPSVHNDLRYENDNNFLSGWTLLTQREGTIRVPPLEVGDGKYSAEAYDKDPDNWKIDLNKGKIVSKEIEVEKKPFIPPEWLDVEGVFKPNDIPSTKDGHSVMRIVRKGIIETGYMTSYAKEYFLDFGNFRWHWMIRRIMIDRPIWICIFDEGLPYYLKPRAVKNNRIPPYGYSGIPKYMRERVPPEYQYWKIRDEKERISVRNRLVENIKDILSQHVKAGEMNTNFVLQFHYSEPSRSVKRIGVPANYEYLLRIAIKDEELLTMVMEMNPLDSNTSCIIRREKRFEGKTDWFHAGENGAEKFTSGSASYGESAGYIRMVDKGSVVISETQVEQETEVRFDFKGKKMKGRYIMKRTDKNTDIWEFGRQL